MALSGNAADAETQQTITIGTAATAGSPSSSNATKSGTLLSGTFKSSTGTPTTYASISPVFVFQLPVLSAGETVSDVSLRLTVSKGGTPSFNGDLYGLGFRASSTVLGTDYYNGALDTTDATLIQDNLFTNAGAVGTVATSGTLSSLLNYLIAQYAAGGAGNFIFLRISPDFTTFGNDVNSSSTGYAVQATEGSTAATIPQLTVTTVPEPGAAGLLFGGVALAGGLRRRR